MSNNDVSNESSEGRRHIRMDADAQYWDRDLHPNNEATENIEGAGYEAGQQGAISTAYDIKGLHNRLQEFTNDDLKNIPVLPTGSRLEQNGSYVDLRLHDPKEFTARDDAVAGPKNWYVAKRDVDYVLWNRLIGIDNPARLDENPSV